MADWTTEANEMNQMQRAIARNDSARLLEFTSRGHRNCIRININNSIQHEMKKLEIAYRLKEAGIEFVCEAEFKGKKCRTDIFDLDNQIAIEILESESQESIEEKRRKYPCRIVQIRTDMVFKEEMIR